MKLTEAFALDNLTNAYPDLPYAEVLDYILNEDDDDDDEDSEFTPWAAIEDHSRSQQVQMIEELEAAATRLLADRDSLAVKFFDELYESHESFELIPDQHNTVALGQLLYLQGAILKNSMLECTADEFAHMDEILKPLPSYTTWLTYIERIE